MTISVHDPYPGVAGELAGKFAEYAGAEADAAKDLARAVEASVAGAGPEASADLDLSWGDRELVVVVTAASAKKLTCPLPY